VVQDSVVGAVVVGILLCRQPRVGHVPVPAGRVVCHQS
jgi:hypothetical protein